MDYKNENKDFGRKNTAADTGSIKSKLQKKTHDVGDGIEKVGRKLQQKGHPKLGDAVEALGDKIEHMAD